MSVIIIIAFAFIVLGILLWLLAVIKNHSFGSLSKKYIYSDTDKVPGQVLYSDRLALKGKPDYIINNGSSLIPVEIKTGKTPYSPYRNHLMQVIAYCALIEENYQNKVPYGVIKYPEKEFTIEFTQERKSALRLVIKEMITLRESGYEPQCRHPQHQID